MKMSKEEPDLIGISQQPGAGSAGDSTTSTATDNRAQVKDEEGNSEISKPLVRANFIAFFIVLCQLVQAIPYGAGLLAAIDIPKALGGSQSKGVWIAASYPLTQGAFVLIGGRIGAIYGHKTTMLAGASIYVLFHLLTGFMRSIDTVIVMRALSGIGGGTMVPNAIALLTITYPPGLMRNIWVGLFGAMGPVGAAGGTVFPGFFGQLTSWWWLFFFLAILGTIVFGIAAVVVPGEDIPLDAQGSVDYIGSYLGVTGLVLFNFVWTQAGIVGWEQPYVYALLIVSILHLALFLVWEGRFAKEPILPLGIWTSPSFAPMVFSAFLSFMGVGIFLYDVQVWNIEIRHYSNLLTAAANSAFATVGTCGCFVSAIAVRYLPAQVVMAIGALAAVVASTIFATMPVHQTYWAQCFPAFIIMGFSPDFMFTAAQIITSNSVRRAHQGIAGSLMGTIQMYGLSTGLGFAGTVEHYTNDGGRDQVGGIRHALYLTIGMAAAAALVALLFVRIPKDRREGWDHDDQPA
ncbi:major facilitator superfamily domain-containing protein [Xylogone sp. PMI_703]|nr:major facilitator superfamily domain-containing protein [Xylogone sp. PMI_703]